MENQRGITVSSSIGTILEEIINRRLLKTIKFTQAQAGGQKGASATDHIFILRNIMDIAKKEGRRHTYLSYCILHTYTQSLQQTGCYELGHRNKKNYETYNNERKETCFCKFKQVSDRKRQKASNMHIVTDSK